MQNIYETIPPHSAEIEMAALSCFFVPESARIVIETLKELDFYIPRHQKIFRFFKQCLERYGMLDEITVGQNLKQEARDYVGKIVLSGSAANVEAYCKQLLEYSSRRQSIRDSYAKAKLALIGPVETRSTGTVRLDVDRLLDHCGRMERGEIYCVPLPFEQLGKATNMLYPGTVSVVCGGGGGGKSLWMQQVFMWMHSQWKCAYLGLEDSLEKTGLRVIAQLAQRTDLTVMSTWRKDGNEGRSIIEQFRGQLQAFGKCIEKPHKDETASVDFAIQWVRRRCEDGYRVLCIDPFTFLEATDNAYRSDQRFMNQIIQIVERANATLILVTHPIKDAKVIKGTVSVSQLAGGAAIERHSRCILWYQECKEASKDCFVGGEFPVQERLVNRTMTVCKANNSYGKGQTYGFYLSIDSLAAEEQGRLIGRNELPKKDDTK